MAVSKSGKRVSDEALLLLQREANQKLVLHALRAQDELDEALGAQRQAEDEASDLRAREAALEAAAKFREQFIGIVGHDLRNPLNTMIRATELIVARGSLSEQDARMASRVVQTGERMAKIIGQLVAYTRAKSGYELRLQPSNLESICRNIADELTISSSAEFVHTSDGDVRGTWDTDRLAEAVSNIMGNAVEHATAGSQILVHVVGQGDTVCVHITNHGACIPEELLPEIFSAYRGQARFGRQAGHLGLGLFIASEIAAAHFGTISVLSGDQTTTFVMCIPRSPSVAAEIVR